MSDLSKFVSKIRPLNTLDNSDTEIWQKARTGDISSFSLIFKKYYSSLYQFTGRFVRDAQTADNIVQDLFVYLWIHRKDLHIKSSLKSYLYISAKNRSVNYLKHRSRDNDLCDHNITFPSAEESYLEKEKHAAVHKAINLLPEKCRQIYLMKRYDNLTYTEIAHILDISVNTVKKQLNRALKSLYKQLAHMLAQYIW